MLGIGIGEEYFGYGPEVEYDVKREYSPDESSVELTSWFCSSAQCSPGILSAVVMIAVSAKAVKLSSTPCRAIRELNGCCPSESTLTASNEFD